MLSSSIPSAGKDCRKCNRRRIRCDRKLPHCNKCVNKGLDCPGYGFQYRWTNAMESHGRLKILGKPRGLRIPGFQESTRAHEGKVVREIAPETRGLSQLVTTEETLHASTSQQLLHHYATSIAPDMVWLDSEQNEYKRLVVPLAETQNVLRLAILANAAAHVPKGCGDSANLSESACKSALLIITERVRIMTMGTMDISCGRIAGNCNTDVAVLAATLVLLNHSLSTLELSLAQIHGLAVRALIASMAFSNSSDDDTFIFLKNQAAIHDILACTTVFDSDHIKQAILPDLRCENVLFGRFLEIIHNITTLSLSRQKLGTHIAPIDISDLEDNFELARVSTLSSAFSLNKSRARLMKDDFTRLVQTYHHAGVLYACKRLETFGDTYIEEYHTSRLFRTFEVFEDISASLHNLAWPIFIAGICSWPNVERMRAVSKLSKMASENSRFKYFHKISAFHEEVWGSPHHDWIPLARQWEDGHIPIIAV